MARQQTLEYACHPLAAPVFANSKQIIVDTVDTLCRYLGSKQDVCRPPSDETESTKYKSHTVADVGFGEFLRAVLCYFKSTSFFVCTKSPACIR